MHFSGRLTDRIGGGPVVLSGLSCWRGHVALRPGRRARPYWLLVVALVVRGVGLGFTMMPAMASAYALLERHQVPRATPMLNVLQRVGGSVGVAVLAVVLERQLRGATARPRSRRASRNTYWWSFGLVLVALVPAFCSRSSSARSGQRLGRTPAGKPRLRPAAACRSRRRLDALQRPRAAGHALPRVALGLKRARRLSSPSSHRAELRIGQLLPVQRRGHRRLRQGAHRVGRHARAGRRRCGGRRRRSGPRACACGTPCVRLPGRRRRARADIAGELRAPRRSRPAAQRHDDVQPARAGRHREGREADGRAAASPSARAAARTSAKRSLARVEVEDEAVGLARLVRAREPDVRRDHVLAGQVDERRRVVGQHLAQRPALALGHLAPVRSSRGSARRAFFTKKPMPSIPSGKRCRASGRSRHVRHHHRRDRARSGARGRAWSRRASGNSTWSACVIGTSAPAAPYVASVPRARPRSRGLVVAQAEEARVAQPAVARPLGEADLRDELGLDPGHVALLIARRRRTAGRRARSGAQPLAEIAQRRARRSRCRPCPRTRARRRRSSRAAARRTRARALRRRVAADHELLPVLALELQPVARARRARTGCRRAWRSRPPSPCGRPRAKSASPSPLRCGVKPHGSVERRARRAAAACARAAAARGRRARRARAGRRRRRRPARARCAALRRAGRSSSARRRTRRPRRRSRTASPRSALERLGDLRDSARSGRGRCATAAARAPPSRIAMQRMPSSLRSKIQSGSLKRSSVRTAFIASEPLGGGSATGRDVLDGAPAEHRLRGVGAQRAHHRGRRGRWLIPAEGVGRDEGRPDRRALQRPRVDLRAQARRHPLRRRSATAARVRLLSRNDLSLERALPRDRRGAGAPSRRRASRSTARSSPSRAAQTSFARLAERGRGRCAVFYYVFDVLVARRRGRARRCRCASASGCCATRCPSTDPMRLTPHRNGDGEELFAEACRKGWEGLIAKRADSPYAATRSRDWLKFKCEHGQELVIGGFTAPRGSRDEFGALLLGYFADGELRYAGKVGTGFDHATLRELGGRLRALRARRAAVRRRRRDPRARRALGRARARRAGRLHRVDARRPAAPPALPRPARRQAGARGGARGMTATLKVGRRTIEITHPDKVLFPDADGDQARPRPVLRARRAGDAAPRARPAARAGGPSRRDRGARGYS